MADCADVGSFKQHVLDGALHVDLPLARSGQSPAASRARETGGSVLVIGHGRIDEGRELDQRARPALIDTENGSKPAIQAGDTDAGSVALEAEVVPDNGRIE